MDKTDSLRKRARDKSSDLGHKWSTKSYKDKIKTLPPTLFTCHWLCSWNMVTSYAPSKVHSQCVYSLSYKISVYWPTFWKQHSTKWSQAASVSILKKMKQSNILYAHYTGVVLLTFCVLSINWLRNTLPNVSLLLIKKIVDLCITWLKWPQVQFTAVSGFIEQVGSMIKGIPKHNYYLSTTSQFHLASKS